MQGVLLQPKGVQRDTQAKRSLHFIYIHTHTYTPAPLRPRRPPSLASICRTQLFCARLRLLSVHELNMASVSVLSPRTFTVPVPWGGGGPAGGKDPPGLPLRRRVGQGRGWYGRVGPGLPLASVFEVQPPVAVPLGMQQAGQEGVLGGPSPGAQALQTPSPCAGPPHLPLPRTDHLHSPSHSHPLGRLVPGSGGARTGSQGLGRRAGRPCQAQGAKASLAPVPG